MSSWDPSIRTSIDPFVDLVSNSNFSEAGKLMIEKTRSEKGFLLAVAIEQIGNSLSSAFEVGKISVEGRVKVQYLALSLIQQVITHEQASLLGPVESSRLFVPPSSSLDESVRAMYCRTVTDYTERLIAVFASGYDEKKAELIINVLERAAEARLTNYVSGLDPIEEVAKSSMYDPTVLKRFNEQLAVLICEMNATAKALLNQDLDKVNQMSEDLKNCIRIAFLNSPIYIARTEYK